MRAGSTTPADSSMDSARLQKILRRSRKLLEYCDSHSDRLFSDDLAKMTTKSGFGSHDSTEASTSYTASRATRSILGGIGGWVGSLIGSAFEGDDALQVDDDRDASDTANDSPPAAPGHEPSSPTQKLIKDLRSVHWLPSMRNDDFRSAGLESLVHRAPDNVLVSPNHSREIDDAIFCSHEKHVVDVRIRSATLRQALGWNTDVSAMTIASQLRALAERHRYVCSSLSLRALLHLTRAPSRCKSVRCLIFRRAISTA